MVLQAPHRLDTQEESGTSVMGCCGGRLDEGVPHVFEPCCSSQLWGTILDLVLGALNGRQIIPEIFAELTSHLLHGAAPCAHLQAGYGLEDVGCRLGFGTSFSTCKISTCRASSRASWRRWRS